MKEIGNVEPVRQLASSLGIPKEKIPPYPSIALGTPELSVMDMAGAYTAFANDGVYTHPEYIKSIEDANGRLIYVSNQTKKRAISSGYNYAMVDILKHAQGAAGLRAGLKSEFGGKTGTTNDHKNGWFMGITPDLVVATWVGGDNEWIRFLSLADGQGGVMARPFCTKFLSRIEADSKVDYDASSRFKVPDVLEVNTDCSVYAAMEEEDKKSAEQDLLDKAKEEDEVDEEF
jgi:penicillin-binding protein 1A